MGMEIKKLNLMNFDRAAMAAWFEARGEKPFRAQQLLKWIHQQGVVEFDAMTNLSKALREDLKAVAEIHGLTIVADQNSSDGSRKWLFELADGNRIESVYIPEAERATLCISSQVGCALNCSFCSTARQGFNRNLSTAEIIGQLWTVNRLLGDDDSRPVSNVVFMGMGEPLDCLEAKLQFGHALRRPLGHVAEGGIDPADPSRDAFVEPFQGLCDVPDQLGPLLRLVVQHAATDGEDENQ